MQTTAREQLKALTNLVTLMSEERDLPMDLKITLEEIKDYIIRNK